MNLSPTLRQVDFLCAVEIAKKHIPIERAVSANPVGFVILDKGTRYAVYSRKDFEDKRLRDGRTCFPLTEPITGAHVATVNLDGTVTMHVEIVE